MILIKDRHTQSICVHVRVDEGNMILIKDRHIARLSSNSAKLSGKYDTYKGSTLSGRL